MQAHTSRGRKRTEKEIYIAEKGENSEGKKKTLWKWREEQERAPQTQCFVKTDTMTNFESEE